MVKSYLKVIFISNIVKIKLLRQLFIFLLETCSTLFKQNGRMKHFPSDNLHSFHSTLDNILIEFFNFKSKIEE